MHILIVTGTFPTKSFIKEAADIVSYSISEELGKKHKLDLQVINFKNSLHSNNDMPKDTDRLFNKILPSIKVKNNSLTKKIYRSFLNINQLINYENKIFDQYISNYNYQKYDVILTIWTEIGTKIVSNLPNKKIAYYGNLESEVVKSNAFLNLKIRKNLKNIINYFFWFLIRNKENNVYFYHLSKYKHIFDVSYIDYKKLLSKGISSSYLQMTWDQNYFEQKILANKVENKSKHRICCSVGRLSNTGNSFGFLTLLEEIIPEIKKNNLENFFKLEIYGGGEFRDKSLRNKLLKNNVYIMGFVENLEAELDKSTMSIIPHNRSLHKVSHTRVLHNWMLGIPIILFEESKLAMPELENEYNCLLASNANNFVNLMLKLATDVELQSKLIKNGRITLNEKFNSRKVSQKIESEFCA